MRNRGEGETIRISASALKSVEGKLNRISHVARGDPLYQSLDINQLTHRSHINKVINDETGVQITDQTRYDGHNKVISHDVKIKAEDFAHKRNIAPVIVLCRQDLCSLCKITHQQTSL